MKKTLLISLVMVATTQCVLAQFPLTDLYQYNYTSISPVFAGVDGQKITVMGTWCKACRGIGQPSGGFMGYETSIDRINSGIGVNASMTQLGPGKDIFINILYNYRLDLGNDQKLIFGTKFGIVRNSIDFTMYQPVDPNDPLLNAPTSASIMNPSLSLGVMYKRERFFVGLSVDNLLPKKEKFDAQGGETFGEYMLSIISGVDFKLGESLSSTHSVYVIRIGGYTRADLNNTVLIKDWIIRV